MSQWSGGGGVAICVKFERSDIEPNILTLRTQSAERVLRDFRPVRSLWYDYAPATLLEISITPKMCVVWGEGEGVRT